MEPILCREWLL